MLLHLTCHLLSKSDELILNENAKKLNNASIQFSLLEEGMDEVCPTE